MFAIDLIYTALAFQKLSLHVKNEVLHAKHLILNNPPFVTICLMENSQYLFILANNWDYWKIVFRSIAQLHVVACSSLQTKGVFCVDFSMPNFVPQLLEILFSHILFARLLIKFQNFVKYWFILKIAKMRNSVSEYIPWKFELCFSLQYHFEYHDIDFLDAVKVFVVPKIRTNDVRVICIE